MDTTKNSSFDPNKAANTNNNIFGLPYTKDEARIIITAMPWDVTVSYKRGTADAPASIFNASFQVDLYDPFLKDAYKVGLFMEEINEDIINKNNILSKLSSKYIDFISDGGILSDSPEMQEIVKLINNESEIINQWLMNNSLANINNGKLVAVIGGEHSCPLGLIRALAQKHDSFSILHIDAHADLRVSYEDFDYSHASIMYNAMKLPQIKKLVQVGIRDYCEDELNYINNSEGRIKTFFQKDIQHSLIEGKTWKTISDEIVNTLTQKVYISFDVDGLDSKYCPNTGTPVPDGLEYEQILYTIEKLCNAGKTIIGFDICETGKSDDEWDENVTARLLYRISNIMAKSNNLKF